MDESSKSQKIYEKINVDATIRLAKLAVKSDVKIFIFVSSVKAGGALLLGFVQVRKIKVIQKVFMERLSVRQNYSY
ncbi:MAG: hypothetical protein ACJ0BR_02120 [Candidatus Puniceispirillales bacterium]